MHFLSVLSTNRKITVKPAPFSRRSSNVWLEAQLSKIHEQRSRAGDKKRGNRLEISVGPRCVSLPDVFRSDCRIDRVRSRCLLHACNASCIYMHITDDAAGARQRVCVCVCVCVETGYNATGPCHTHRMQLVVHVCTPSGIHAQIRIYSRIRKLVCNWERCAR